MHSYLLNLSYHGYHYHGWARQKNLPTIEGDLLAGWQKIFPHKKLRLFATSRTDAQVHAQDQWVKLVTDQELFSTDGPWFIEQWNFYVSSDIRILLLRDCPPKFDIMGAALSKEYHYTFRDECYQHEKLMQTMNESCFFIEEKLDIVLMQKAASMFIGEHSFHHFCRHEGVHRNVVREIFSCEILQHDLYYQLRVVGNGFLKQMVRFMMGALINVGLHRVTCKDLQVSLVPGLGSKVGFVVPGYGLSLMQVNFNEF